MSINKIFGALAVLDKIEHCAYEIFGAVGIAVYGISAAVVGQGDVIKLNEWAVKSERLVGEYLESRTGDAVFAKDFCKIIIVNEICASSVDECRGGLHKIKLVLSDDLLLGESSCVHRNDVGLCKEGVGVNERNVPLCKVGIIGGNCRVCCENANVEGLKLFGNKASDSAEADKSDCLVAKLKNSANVGESLAPLAVFERVMCAGYVSGFADHKADGEFCNCVAVMSGVVKNGDSKLVCSLEINVLKSAAVGEDVFEIGSGFKKLAGNGAEVNHKDICVLDSLINFSRRREGTGSLFFDLVCHSAHFVAGV